MKNLFVVIDYQNVVLSYDPEQYKDELDHASVAIQKTADLVDTIRDCNNCDIAWVAYAPKTEDALSTGISGIHPDLQTRMNEEDYLFIKDTKTAFGSRDESKGVLFDDVMAKNYDNIIITGTSLIDCVKETIQNAAEAGLEDKLIIPRDACSPSPAFTIDKDNYLNNHPNLTLCSTHQLDRYLRQEGPLTYMPFNKSAQRCLHEIAHHASIEHNISTTEIAAMNKPPHY